ncbi:MAG: DUF393 domain-containing protein [Paludibacter sp.]|nr:DUF393 domain-containing protein [Paludibacter sp.]
MYPNHIIIFDGVCNLCCGWVNFLIRKDKYAKFTFASLQSESGKKLSDIQKLNSIKTDSIIYIKDNQHFIESEAILEIIKDLGGFWKLFLIFRFLPTSILNLFYKYIAQKRYKVFGKRVSCMIPTPELQKRFLT